MVTPVKRVRLMKVGGGRFTPWHVSRRTDGGHVTVCRPKRHPFELKYMRWELVPVVDLHAWRLCTQCVRTIRAANKKSAAAPSPSSPSR